MLTVINRKQMVYVSTVQRARIAISIWFSYWTRLLSRLAMLGDRYWNTQAQ